MSKSNFFADVPQSALYFMEEDGRPVRADAKKLPENPLYYSLAGSDWVKFDNVTRALYEEYRRAANAPRKKKQKGPSPRQTKFDFRG